jgi:hypothetical protein
VSIISCGEREQDTDSVVEELTKNNGTLAWITCTLVGGVNKFVDRCIHSSGSVRFHPPQRFPERNMLGPQ